MGVETHYAYRIDPYDRMAYGEGQEGHTYDLLPHIILTVCRNQNGSGPSVIIVDPTEFVDNGVENDQV